MAQRLIYKNAWVKRASGLVPVLLLLLSMQTAQAGPILDTPILGGNMLVASDGHVYARFLGSDAGYYNTLFLDSPGDMGDRELFNKYSATNYSIDLGYYSAGTELIFRLDVSNTQLSYFTGAGSRNPDDLDHALAITSLLDNGLYITRVGFEDLLGGGDEDYNDFMFELVNVLDPPGAVPEPSVLLLFAGGIFSIILSRRRKR